MRGYGGASGWGGRQLLPLVLASSSRFWPACRLAEGTVRDGGETCGQVRQAEPGQEEREVCMCVCFLSVADRLIRGVS